MNEFVMSVRQNSIEFCKALDLRHEMVCQKLCRYLEAKKKYDGRANGLVSWRYRLHSDIYHHVKGGHP